MILISWLSCQLGKVEGQLILPPRLLRPDPGSISASMQADIISQMLRPSGKTNERVSILPRTHLMQACPSKTEVWEQMMGRL